MNCKLSNLCHYVKDRTPITALNPHTYISTENMQPNKSGITVASSLPDSVNTQAFIRDDVLISNIRPYFKKIYYADFCGGCSNDVLVFRAKPGIDSKFLFYVLSQDAFFDFSTSTSKGTKMPRGDKTAIMNFEVPNFTKEEQVKIATVLSSIDCKIKNNNEINKNLAEQAESIFKQEFLINSSLPEGWTKSNLLNIADYLNGLAMQKFRPKDGELGIPVLKIKELRQGFCDSSSELCSPSIKKDYIINDGDVIFSWSGSLLVDFWSGGKCGLNQHLFKVTSNKFDKWFYYAWTKYYLSKFIFIASDMATTMGHIKREELEKAEVLIPSKDDYKRIGEILKPMYELIIQNSIENKKLSSLRDNILPALMDGSLDVSGVEL